MARSKINVYLEAGKKRTFAGALDWPGWCRSGKDETSALQALLDYGPRYARVLRASRLGFKAPTAVSNFVVVERLKGNATTDFGAPGMAPSADTEPVDAKELKRFQKLLKACWRAFDQAVDTAVGKSLRTGPRGGGRQLEGVLEHLLGSDAGYLNGVGWKLQQDTADDPAAQLKQTRQAILDALEASAHGEIPAKGPRGGKRWSPRYFVRRIAWHILDHAWEIEDRMPSS
ncbi:MAG: DinB family protein [Chloroflexi bacterium]|nr:MAG: DinB family protein [Chloroflexota bacterium]